MNEGSRSIIVGLATAAVLALGAAHSAHALTPVGDEFLVNEFTTGSQHCPVVATGADGSFVVVWTDDSPALVLRAQLYDKERSPVGSSVLVSNRIRGLCDHSVTMERDGSFVAVWEYSGVHGRRFASNAIPLGQEFLISDDSDGNGTGVTAGEPGELVVVWTTYDYYVVY